MPIGVKFLQILYISRAVFTDGTARMLTHGGSAYCILRLPVIEYSHINCNDVENYKGLEAMMLTRRIFPAKALLVWVSLSCAVLFAQSERGTITGTVRDSTGAVVPKARVVVTNIDTKLVS